MTHTSPVSDQEERLALAIRKARGFEPDTLYQHLGDNYPIDFTDSQGRTFYKSWRKELPSVRAVLAELCSTPAQAAVPSIEDITKTISNEWGSHLCYRDTYSGRRTCNDEACRCHDIAMAIVSQHGVAAAPPQASPAGEEYARIAESHVGAADTSPPMDGEAYDEACRDIAKAIRDTFAAPPQAWLEAKAEVDTGWPEKGEAGPAPWEGLTAPDGPAAGWPDKGEPPAAPQEMPDPVDIGNAIIAGIASGDGPLEQMNEIVSHLERAGFEIRPAMTPAIPAVRTYEETIDILHRHIKLEWLNASDGRPDIIGFGEAALALSRPPLNPVEKIDGDQS